MASAPGFPQVMTHPQHRAAVVANIDSNPNAPGYGLPGSPERFPPIEVHNEDQEAATRARGYLRYGEQMPALAQFSEYPKIMSHPDHVDAVPLTKASRIENGSLITFDIPGKPAIMPDVTVQNADQEAEWEGKGYSAPKSDPLAFEKAQVAPGKPGSEWPKWVDGVLAQDPDMPADLSAQYPKWLHFEGGDSQLANDPAHEARILQARGSDKYEPVKQPDKPYVPPAAAAPVIDEDYRAFLEWKAAKAAAEAAPAVSDDDADRTTLIALAAENGIDIDKRWKTARLREVVMGAGG